MSSTANSSAASSGGIRNRYDEIFEVEIDGWCYGISHFPGEVHAALVHRVIKELSNAFKDAIEANYPFNALDLATRISRAAKYLVPEKEVAFAILYQIPNPIDFDEEGQLVIGKIVDRVANAYPGSLEKVQRKWRAEMAKKKKKEKDASEVRVSDAAPVQAVAVAQPVATAYVPVASATVAPVAAATATQPVTQPITTVTMNGSAVNNGGTITVPPPPAPPVAPLSSLRRQINRAKAA